MYLTILLSIFFWASPASSLRQEISFHETYTDNVPGSFYTFQTHIPDTSLYPLERTVRVCYSGAWVLYPGVNYWGDSIIGFTGVNHCRNQTYDETRHRSFRHFGAWDTEVDAISLYGHTGYVGEEILVDSWGYIGITSRVASLSITGRIGWTLFEGLSFDGPSACIQAPDQPHGTNFADNLSYFNLSTIGSVATGCSSRAF